MNFLARISAVKEQEVAKLRKDFTENDWLSKIASQQKPVPFLQNPQVTGALALIAEVKKASPSKGNIQALADPVKVAKQYDSSGADAISILTDREFFSGSIADFEQVRAVTGRPLLRKDFIIDEWQVYEARAIGADAILLIAAILSPVRLQNLHSLAQKLGMSVLLEVHNKEELERLAVIQQPQYVGINNRDLKTFQVDLATTESLAPYARELYPTAMLISESGFFSGTDTARVQAAGAQGVLVGEALMRLGLNKVPEAIADLKGFASERREL